MATPDQRVVSRPQRPAQRLKGSGACLGPLDNLECKESQKLVQAELAMLRKAQEFFQTCDTEGKGFIARRDMQVRGAPAVYLECQIAWVSLPQVSTCPIGGNVFNRRDAISSALEGGVSSNSPGFLFFLTFTCCHTQGLFPLSDSVTPQGWEDSDSNIR